MDRNRVLAVVVLATLIVATGWLYQQQVHDLTRTTPQVEYESTYDPENETLRLTNVGGDDVSADWGVRIYVVSITSPDTYGPAVISADSRRSQTGLWLGSSAEAILTSRTTAGDSVLVVADGTDADGDGRSGIEPGERVRVVYSQPDGLEYVLTSKRYNATLYGVEV